MPELPQSGHINFGFLNNHPFNINISIGDKDRVADAFEVTRRRQMKIYTSFYFFCLDHSI